MDSCSDAQGRAAQSFRFAATRTSAGSIADLGRPETLALDSLGLSGEELRSDLVAAAVRKGGDGVLSAGGLRAPRVKSEASAKGTTVFFSVNN